jgi:tetratricopeptide (TPR) repeat protein
MTPNADRVFRSPQAIIGREHELAQVDAALFAPQYGDKIFYFEGEGGIGKTRLLLEALDHSGQYEQTLATEVIDLYLTRYHQPIRIMHNIVWQLRKRLPDAQDDAYFADYRREEQKFLAAGESDIDQERRASVDNIFLADYARLAQKYRIVLLVDTLEKLHPELSATETFDFLQHSRLENWLIDLIAKLPNTLTLLAGRPRPRQRKLLQERLGLRLTILPIQPFTFIQTDAYIREALADTDESVAMAVEQLHHACGGRPVVLTIALACAQAYGAGMIALPAGFGNQYPHNREQLSEAFVNLIVRDLQVHLPELANLLTKAVYLRKGLRVPILEQIARDEGFEPDRAAIEQQLDTFSRYAFVKPIGEWEVILHDELYELLFNKLPVKDVHGWYRAAIRYLEKELQQTKDKMRSGPGEMRSLQKIQTMQVERLFYQMSLDPYRGYQSYRLLSHSTIHARNEDFDTQLRDELARFFDMETRWGRHYHSEIERKGMSWDQILYDEGLRWIHRRLASQGPDRYIQAIKLAEHLRQQYAQIYTGQTLARCDLDAMQLQAEVYIPETTPRGSEIVNNYKVLTQDLERLLSNTTDSRTGQPLNNVEIQHANFVLANAYNYWGYYERTQEQLQRAIERYKKAIYRFKELSSDKELGSEVDSQQATTLNNLGFALGRQGFSDSGLVFVQKALEIVLAQGMYYQIATTLNTMARLQMDINDVSEALTNVSRAREIFEQQDSQRGLALCAVAEGRVRNRMAILAQTHEDQDEAFALAVQRYSEAIKRFDIEGELSRRIEARVFISKVYRDWGKARNARGEDGGNEIQKALQVLQEAEDLCTLRTPNIIRVSILEAITVIYVDQNHYNEALEVLNQARALIPKEFDPDLSIANPSATQEMRLFWLRLAQIELQSALCRFGQGDRHLGCIHLLRAFASLLTFSASLRERFRELAKDALAQISSVEELEVLRNTVREEAQKLHIRQDALAEIEQIFEQIETKFLLS